MRVIVNTLARAAICAAFALLLCQAGVAQGPVKKPATGRSAAKKTDLPKVTQIDIEGLRKVLKPTDKPLLINVWATWCDPCREEFPDLVKLDTAYRGKIDFITISLDDLADINTLVPKFLGEMRAKMPAYLLRTPDEDAAISLITRGYNGTLPFTVLYTPAGEAVYSRKGKIHYETVTAEIDKLLATAAKPAGTP